MPRQSINYNNTIIYKIVCKDLNINYVYVGHTTSFSNRKREHKSRCNNNYTFLVYNSIRENGGWDNWDMIEIEKYPCNDSNEARCRERYWYEILGANINSRCPTEDIQKKNNRQSSREYIEYHKQYHMNRKNTDPNYMKNRREYAKQYHMNKKNLSSIETNHL